MGRTPSVSQQLYSFMGSIIHVSIPYPRKPIGSRRQICSSYYGSWDNLTLPFWAKPVGLTMSVTQQPYILLGSAVCFRNPYPWKPGGSRRKNWASYYGSWDILTLPLDQTRKWADPCCISVTIHALLSLSSVSGSAHMTTYSKFFPEPMNPFPWPPLLWTFVWLLWAVSQ